MQFSNEKPIYLQISEYVMDRILLGEWQEKEKIPSVRDLAAHLEVNANTVMRAYDHLQQQEIIFNKRGIGFFAHHDAKALILKARKKHFLNDELAVVFRAMDMLGISIEEINTYYRNR
ncbi:GntR family transcriptional regulator [Sphingobacterium sp. lm-10]|uniref:GntR family transcriptional regulator n=1 Tax=Sphingobacterium sp. lm-10 TaxID=2944904 RepID=UPI00201FE91C|nr:GntR family transcriptional regulator [Sphingobacterium sp. lm-10]MCL7987441.1 GntR family transcriptional regulator [Sphingobacterium sp. lm-10]